MDDTCQSNGGRCYRINSIEITFHRTYVALIIHHLSYIHVCLCVSVSNTCIQHLAVYGCVHYLVVWYCAAVQFCIALNNAQVHYVLLAYLAMHDMLRVCYNCEPAAMPVLRTQCVAGDRQCVMTINFIVLYNMFYILAYRDVRTHHHHACCIFYSIAQFVCAVDIPLCADVCPGTAYVRRCDISSQYIYMAAVSIRRLKNI